MPIAPDVAYSAGRNRVRDRGCPPSMATKYAKAGTIYYESRIGPKGYDGWRPQQTSPNTQSNPPVGLTPWPVYGEHDSMALFLSTGDRPYAAGQQDAECATWRGIQLSAIPERFLKFSAIVAIFDGGFTNSWANFKLCLDMQLPGNTSRSLAAFGVRAGLAAPDYNKAFIWGDNNGVSHPTIDVPNSSHLVAGINENKQSATYVSFTWDRLANGGLGGYCDAQIGASQFDLTGLGGGSSNEPMQLPNAASGAQIEDFIDTINMGLVIDRSTTVTTAYPAGISVSGMALSGHTAA